MQDSEIKKIADDANLIVAGYAYTVSNGNIRVLNLENTDSAAVLSPDGDMISTTMNDMELTLVQSYYLKNKELME
jgi:hypothetical protein